MFHIDFGFIVGQEPPLKGFLRAPFKFTKLVPCSPTDFQLPSLTTHKMQDETSDGRR